MAVHEIRIDRAATLAEEPAKGHNRWHPDIPPVLRCQPGDEVVMETRDAFDGQMGPHATLKSVEAPDLGVVHPLTGPVYVEGARPGDLLEIEILEVVPDTYGYTVQVPGFGFLRDAFPEPFMVRWRLDDGFATSRDLPGVRIPAAPFMGTIGLSPGHQSMARITAREQASLERGGFVLPPSADGAVPRDPGIAVHGLRTVPPREQAGNVDIKQLTAGTKLIVPVDTPGALFSAGDAHYAQGDGEACGTAIEMSATLRVRFAVLENEAGITGPRFVVPRRAEPERSYYATTGMSVSRDGEVSAEDLTLAARNALLSMIDHLGERGWTRQQAYALCSVAVDLKVSQLVDVPNLLVSAFLPLDIFD
ncbi:acetamidase/formamidase family protein [Nonomuraea sp. NPDC050556]|uniref:acetamidase/formamidase family protein n=1 Tax=Nonomuraea sp. NPDC050556 TaxID=3364369 RepID=UPI0037A80A93